ncbi:ABC transporter permease, partial [Bacteroidota bacterium]
SAWIAQNFLDFFGIELICGRNYLESDLTNLSASDNGDKGIIINESAAGTLGFSKPEDALGKSIIYDDEVFGRVIGVINDYHQQSLDKQLRPTIFFGGKWGFYYIFKIDTYNIDETLSVIKDKFNRYYPGNAFVYSFIDEVFDNQYKADIQFGKLFSLFALFAVLIACLGLFGLASFTTLQRTKEIGIRKVLGASLQNILILIAKDFFKLILLSIAIAIPTAYYVMNLWLENYVYKSNIGWWFYVLPVIAIVVVALLAVGYQIVKAAISNPVEALKYE